MKTALVVTSAIEQALQCWSALPLTGSEQIVLFAKYKQSPSMARHRPFGRAILEIALSHASHFLLARRSLDLSPGGSARLFEKGARN